MPASRQAPPAKQSPAEQPAPSRAEKSFFHRKFHVGRLKRSKMADARPALANGSSTQQQPPGVSRAGESALEQVAHPEIRSDASQSENSMCGPAGQGPRPSPADGPAREDNGEAAAAPSADFGGPDSEQELELDDHIETLTFHPETQSAETSDISETERPKASRLSKAARAILLFRRAATSPASDHGNQNGPQAAHRLSRSFVANLWSRQNTADNSTTCARSSRVSSLASSNNARSHHSLVAFLSGAGGASAGEPSSARDGASVSSSFSLPRFIVPKMNALKLPIVCLVKSLEDELMREIFVHRYELGQYLMDNLKVSLGLKDEKYFGLKLADTLEEQEDVRKPWLDLNESVYKQIGRLGRLAAPARPAPAAGEPSLAGLAASKSVTFYLRVKFYPPNLARAQDQFLRQYLWLQLRRDLRLGKLTSSMNNLTYLMACVLQYELGDHRDALVAERLPGMNILPNQDLIEHQAIEIWQRKLAGAQRHLVLMQFLRASVILETYGFDYYPVRDHQRQRAFLLGFNYAGVKTIRNGRIANHFRWHNLSKISYERRMIIFHIYPSENSKRKQILGFKCLSNDECQNLYLRLLEQKYFFTVDLAYFDKSIRHPSHLQDPLAADQRQPSDELSDGDQAALARRRADTPAGVRARSVDVDQAAKTSPSEAQRAWSAYNTDTRRPEAAPGGRPEGDQLSWRRLNFQQQRRPPETSESTPDSSLEWQARRWQPAASSSQQQVGGFARTPLTAKSDSLQESSQSEPIVYERSGCLSQPSSPSSSQFTCCAAASGAQSPAAYFCSASPPESACSMSGLSTFDASQPRAGNQQGRSQAPLRRQRSFAKYSPECAPDVCRERGAVDERRTPVANGTQVGAGVRLAEWTERLLVQPAAMLGRPDDWFEAGRADASPDGQVEPGALGETLKQLFRLCLLVLLLNFLVRLSDGLSSTMIELLSFNSASSSASKLSSTLTRPSEAD